MNMIALIVILLANVILNETRLWSTFITLLVVNVLCAYWLLSHQMWSALILIGMFTLLNVLTFISRKAKDAKRIYPNFQ